MAQLGLQDMPRELRLSLFNVIEPWIFATRYGGEFRRRAEWIYNFHSIRWSTFNIPDETSSQVATGALHDWFFSTATSADSIYDLIEALPQMVFHGYHADYKISEAEREEAQLIQLQLQGVPQVQRLLGR